ncbi:hypothetical protein LCGC14_3008630, partial [marine sediment metagenome]
PMMSVDGPLHNFILRGIHFDGNDLADDPLRLIHVRDCEVSDVTVTNWRDQAIELNTITAASLPTGVAYGMGSCVISNVTIAAPTLTSSQGLLCTGDDRLSVNCGQITFIDLLIQAGTAASDALELGYADNITFISTRLLGTGGVMRFTQLAGATTFPKNNTFVSFFASGGVTGTSGTAGGNLFWPYNTDGSAAIPSISGIFGFSQQEERFFGFSPILDNTEGYQVRDTSNNPQFIGRIDGSDNLLLGDPNIDPNFMDANLKMNGKRFIYGGAITLAASTTPSITGGNLFATNSTASITDFTGEENGQVIILLCGADTTTSLVDSTPLFLAGTFTCTSNDTISLVSNGTVWYELSRGVN